MGTGAWCGAGSVRVGTAAEGGANRLSGHRTRHHSRPKQGYFWLATMLIPAHPCAQLPLTMMPRTHHSKAQYHKKFFRSEDEHGRPDGGEVTRAEECETILGRDYKITAGLRVKLSDAGKEYIRLWDSGNKPEIDNTYFVYNCGNDGL